MKTIQLSTRWLGLALTCGIITFAAHAPAQRPVILSFERSGLLTWSNAYPDAIASVERLSEVVTTGSVVTVTETLGISDGSTQVYSYTVAHPPIVNPSVTISDGTYSWSDVTGYSTNPPGFFGGADYSAGTVYASYPSQVPDAGTPIEVEYSYLPLSNHQEWLSVYSEPVTSQVMQVTVDISEAVGLFRVVNRPSTMVLIPGGSNSGTNPLAMFDGSPESYDSCWYPETYSLSVGSFYMDRYEVTNDKMAEVLQWAYDHGRIAVFSGERVKSVEGDQSWLLRINTETGISWDGGSFGMHADKGSGYPCVNVYWSGAAAYCNYRSEMDGRTPCYNFNDWSCNFSANGYRLPTSEEWEYAARGGLVEKRFPWGDTISHSQANYYASTSPSYDLSSGGHHPSYNDGVMPYTSPVGSFAANAFGLYDMVGNVSEYCTDWHPCYVGSGRETRGGDWVASANYCRVGYSMQLVTCFHLGFRTVLPASQ